MGAPAKDDLLTEYIEDPDALVRNDGIEPEIQTSEEDGIEIEG